MAASRRTTSKPPRTERTVAIGDAARSLGISLDTLRRWDREGRIQVVRDQSNRRRVPVAEIERLSGRPPKARTGGSLSARNRLPGVVRSVEADSVVALVEIDAGPFRLASVITRDAVDELKLRRGDEALAIVKSTEVMIARQAHAPMRPTARSPRRPDRRARRKDR
jgi:molybdopterin-binding protein